MGIKHFIWYEKHRPKKLGQMILPKAHKKRLADYIDNGDIPHLLFHGPQGSGKTTLAQILIDKLPCQALGLNASSKDRGIKVMKENVTEFARSMPLPGQMKVVFLDEADGLTPEAQRSLKGTIERYAKTCRFIFTANSPDRIISEIRSRLIAYEFKTFSRKKLFKYLEKILAKEKVEYEKADVQTVIDRFFPDIRSVVNNLQACVVGGELDPSFITATSVDLDKLTELLLDGRIRIIREMLIGVTDFTFVYRHLFNVVVPAHIGKTEKSDAAITIAEYMFRDRSVIDREINFSACCLELMGFIGCKIYFRS